MNAGGAIHIANSTISGNHAIGGDASGGQGYGGGIAATIYNSTLFEVRNSTIAFNDANGIGGGLSIRRVGGPEPVVISSIVATNEALQGADISGGLPNETISIFGSNNLILDEAPGITLPFDTLRYNPHLLPLANNGGPTPTHALGSCSRAIDAGNNTAGFETDQRGEPYVRGYGPGNDPDIGAYERQPDPDAILKDGFELSAPCS